MLVITAEGQSSLSVTLQVPTGQVMAGAQTSVSIRFTQLRLMLGIFFGMCCAHWRVGWLPRGNGDLLFCMTALSCSPVSPLAMMLQL